MYNGIGLQTARGSGTNGFVQRNLSLIRTTKDKVNYRSEEELIKLEKESIKGPNFDILEHARKRTLELKCAEMEDIMQDQGYTSIEVEDRVAQFRKMLMERDQATRGGLGVLPPKDALGRPLVRETHALAEAQQLKNARLKEAFGISEFFVEGSSLDPDRRAKEEVAKKAREDEEEAEAKAAKAKGGSSLKKYAWVGTPSRSPSPSRRGGGEEPELKKKEKKKKKKRDRSSSRESRKKHKSKKSKRSR